MEWWCWIPLWSVLRASHDKCFKQLRILICLYYIYEEMFQVALLHYWYTLYILWSFFCNPIIWCLLHEISFPSVMLFLLDTQTRLRVAIWFHNSLNVSVTLSEVKILLLCKFLVQVYKANRKKAFCYRVIVSTFFLPTVSFFLFSFLNLQWFVVLCSLQLLWRYGHHFFPFQLTWFLCFVV